MTSPPVSIPFEHRPDLLIGSNALELGYAVGTANARHFQLIPGLNVTQPELVDCVRPATDRPC